MGRRANQNPPGLETFEENQSNAETQRLQRSRGAVVTPAEQETNNQVEYVPAEGEDVLTYAQSRDGYLKAAAELGDFPG